MIYIKVLSTSFTVALVLGWLLIPLLRKLKIGQRVRDDGPRQHLSKAGTPTMGGLIFVLAGLLAAGMFMPRQPLGYLTWFVIIAFASVGFADDFLKVVLKQPLGLKARYKLIGQVLVAALVYLALRRLAVEHVVNIPFVGEMELGLFYPLFVALVLLATTNAVNLSDGLDGLAGGLGVVVLIGSGIIAHLQGASDLAVAAAAMVGGILGFLAFNLHPARVFMGDTGSLAIGGAIAALAVFLGIELLLLLLGGMFVATTLSVIVQVTYFQLTGRRVFLMSPLHHHFELLGWSEWKICLWFWSLQLAMTGAAVLLWLASRGA